MSLRGARLCAVVLLVGVGVRLAGPGLPDGAAPGAPAGREVGQLADGGVHLQDVGEADHDAVFYARVFPSQELPAVIVAVVADVKDRLPPVGDLAEGDDVAVGRLVEGPGFHREPQGQGERSLVDSRPGAADEVTALLGRSFPPWLSNTSPRKGSAMPSIFDRVRLNPRQLRTVAERRLADAEWLRKSGENERANGAMYLGGFVLECLLKARLLEEHPWLQGPLGANPTPEEQRLWSLCYRSHDLAEILERIPGLLRQLERQDQEEGRDRLRRLKRLCSEWTIQARYSPQSATMTEAAGFLTNVKELKECLK